MVEQNSGTNNWSLCLGISYTSYELTFLANNNKQQSTMTETTTTALDPPVIGLGISVGISPLPLPLPGGNGYQCKTTINQRRSTINQRRTQRAPWSPFDGRRDGCRLIVDFETKDCNCKESETLTNRNGNGKGNGSSPWSGQQETNEKQSTKQRIE